MYKAILFDLDGTLLPLDMDKFVQEYFKRLSSYCAQIVEPQKFIKELLTATQLMIKNPGHFTNEDVFMRAFLPAINQEKTKMEPLFEKFYREEFPKLKGQLQNTILASRIVAKAVEKGYKIVLATNPLFPQLAIQHRMEWAGVKNYPWELVTSYENFYSAKPNIAYFQEIADKIGLEPQECLMVGNDVQEDMVASEIGMGTFLVTDYLIDRQVRKYQVQNEGTLLELEDYIANLPSLE